MPVSVVCDNVNAAIRDSIANSSANSTSCGGLAGQNDDQQSLQSKLVASAKRVLLTKVEYEEVSNYNSSFLDNLKSKYMILKPSPPTVGKPSPTNVQIDKETNQNPSASPSSNATSYNTKDAHLPNPKKILFPRESVQIGWRSSGRKWNVGAGMVNVGNTCYLNSTLQALFHVPAMANWLVSDSAHRDKCEDENGTQGGCIICAMSKTLLHSQQSQCPIRPHLVYTKLRMVCKHLIMGRQEDAHEFLRYLVEAMEKSYLARFRNSKELDQYSKETTPLNQILGGYLRSAVRCLACGHISTTFQHFEDLLLDIRKANTLDEALEGYFARERLEDMGYKCESCKKKVAATKQFSLERAPISLCIQLKRFSMIGAKLNKHVGIRTRLDLTPYATKKNSEPLIYRLVSMVTHIGSSQHCGHYTAIGLTESGTYYHFDDSSVRAYAMQNVLNTSAYIIFYELEDSPQRSRQTSTITSREYYEQLKDAGKLNGVTENNDISRQYSSPSTSSSNPMHALNAKVLSKLETSTPGAFIGPQLPEKNSSTYKESSDSHSTITNSNTQPTLNGDVSKPKTNRYYLNNALSKIVNSVNKPVLPNDSGAMSNGTNGATNNNTHAQVTSTTSPLSSTTQKPNQNIVDKLLNHLKAGNTPATNDNATSSSNYSKINGTNHELTDFFPKKSNTNDFNHNTKTESPIKNGDSLTHNGSNSNKTFSHKPDSPVLKEKAVKDRRSETPTKSNGNCLNTSTSSTINISSMNSSFTEHSKSSIKSLVPYETDDEENEDDEGVDASDDSDAASSSSKKQNRKNCVAIKRSKVNNHSYNSDNESSSSFESYSSISRKKLATPSPPVVESKTGYWQVETISTPNKSLLSSSSTAATPTPDKDKKNSFHSTPSPTAISPDNFYSSSPMKHKEKNKQTNHKMNGSNGNHHLNGDNEVVNELSKLSHRGYGAPVLSWNGHKSNMEKEVNEEKRLERKRELEEDEENEMDRGKQKKIKIHGPVGRDNPGYNPFQEYQGLYQNSNNRRWNNGHSNNGRYHNGHVYRQNPHHNHHHHHHHHHNNRNHNNFRRHRFHQRPHHQRNGDSNSYHRRDS